MTLQQQEKRILIVDDSEDMRILLEQILEEEETSYILQFAIDGQQALQKAEAFQPDLILLDMSLPGMSGWDVLPQLRRIPALVQVPVIAVTAHVSQADQERALALGCIAHLGKPFDIETMIDAINRVLAS
jgi:two-component system cell cycle response regulator DivK